MGRRDGDRHRQLGRQGGAGGPAAPITSSTTAREDVAARVRDITGGERVDHVVDVDFGGNLARRSPRCAPMAASRSMRRTAPHARPPIRELMQKNIAVHAMSLPGSPHHARRRAHPTSPAGSRRRAGSFRSRRAFPLYETAAAHRAVERGDNRHDDCRVRALSRVPGAVETYTGSSRFCLGGTGRDPNGGLVARPDRAWRRARRRQGRFAPPPAVACGPPPLTAAARGALQASGRDEETALSRTKKPGWLCVGPGGVCSGSAA